VDVYGVYRFAGPPDGALPTGELTRNPQAYLYGTTWFGGGAQDNGSVFRVRAHQESVVYTFAGGADGGNPIGGLLRDSVGNLYGVTYVGGDTACGFNDAGCGTVYKLDTTGKKTILHAFTGGPTGHIPMIVWSPTQREICMARRPWAAAPGASPTQGAEQSSKWTRPAKRAYCTPSLEEGMGGVPRQDWPSTAAGNLYGTTAAGGGTGCGGAGCGTVFKLTPQ
jgi:uncharacterized repeat protein (TIGR03803 family)